jgi:poly-gamma-glutamate synthesis protein (capsule biosynthesis protein)
MSVRRNAHVRIVIGGDVCPIGRNESLFEQGDAQGLFNDLLTEFERADLRVINLECPLVDVASPIPKIGPTLRAKSGCIAGLKAAGIDVVSLANNHVMDHGARGLKSTLRLCHEAGIDSVGAGETLVDAARIFLREVAGIRIAVAAMAEDEFSIATKDSCGANPLSLPRFLRCIKRERDKADFFIVLLHAGVPHYPYPSPNLRELCQTMIEQGANAVICQHSHCPGCYEMHAGGHIVYGQGNLLFDYPQYKRRTFNRGYLIRISVNGSGCSDLNFVPYSQSEGLPGARRLNEKDERAFLSELQRTSEEMCQVGLVEQKWEALCKERVASYLSSLRGHSRLLRYLNKRTHFANLLYSERARRTLKVILSCDSHREILQTIMTQMSHNGDF